MNAPVERSPSLPTPAVAPPQFPRLAPLLTLLGLIILSLLAGFGNYYEQVAVWRVWDDEGYVMVTASRFLGGKPLYTDVYSQYGPAYYLFQWLALAPVSHHVTHDAVRIQTLVFWGFAALVGGLTAFRLTRSPLAAFAAHLQITMILQRITEEPGHPQGLCLFLLGSAAFIATFFQPGAERRNATLVFAIGCCIGSLIAIKVNLGIYFGLAALLTLLAFAPATRLWNLLVVVAGPGLVTALVLLLLRGNADREWVRSLGTAVLVAAITAFSVARFVWIRSNTSGSSLAEKPFAPSWLIAPAITGAFAAAAVPILFVLLRGTTPGDIWNGMVGQHIGFDGQFIIGLEDIAQPVRSGVTAGLVSLLIVGTLYAAVMRQRRHPDAPLAKGLPPAPVMVPLLILLLAAVRCYLGWQGLPRLVVDAQKQYFLTLLPVLYLVLVPRHFAPIPDAGAAVTQFLPRVLLVLTAILEALWIYPVAGTQPNMASFLPALLGAVLLGDGVTEAIETLTRLADARRKTRTDVPRRGDLLRAIPALLSVGMLLYGVNHYRERITLKGAQYARNVPLGLPGSRLIRLPPGEAAVLQGVTRYLRDNSDTVVTLPGMYSFYFWLERAPPTERNAGAWPILFDDAEQEKLVAAYRERAKSGRVVGLFEPWAVGVWLDPTRHAGDETSRPLFRYITSEFVPAARFREFILLKPRGAQKPVAP